MFRKMLHPEVYVQPRGSQGPKGGVPRARVPGAAGLAALVLAAGSIAVVNPAGAVAVVALDGDGLAAQGVTAASTMKGVPTKLTMGLATLSGEYQAYKQAVASGTARAGTFATKKTMARVVGETVVIDAVAANDPEALRVSLEALGAEVTAVAGRIVSARVPLDRLPDLEYLETLQFARPAIAAKQTGAVTSQGDVAQASDLARSSFGVNGAGSTVGILSDSFNCLGGYAADVGTGDLPAGVNNLSDITTDCSDEGRAMAQIVYDVAPGAGLAFHTAWNGEADFAQGILDLAAAGSTIIVDDVYYYAEPWFQDGVIARAVDRVKAAAVPYFSSAGNSGRKSYQAAFNGSGLTGYIGGELHDFDPGPGVDTRLTIQQNGDTVYIMQWGNPFFSVSGAPGATSDLDICAYSPVGAALPIWCEAWNNLGGDPIEGFSLGGARTLEISIERWSGAAPNPVKIMFYGSMVWDQTESYAGIRSGTIVGHANAGGANAVAASAFFFTPAFGEDPPVLNHYSSVGNTPILFDTAGKPVYQIRQKPQFTAPDGGNNTFFGEDTTRDADTWPNFFGTSAAAPHAAGVAALLREVVPTATPNGITTALQNTAVDILQRATDSFDGPRVNIGVGFDNASGAGLIDALAAVAAIGPPDGIGMWRPGTGRFYLDVNVSYTWELTDVVTAPFGVSTDLPVSGDWNGDGQNDVGVWRPSTGRFYLDANGNRTWDAGDVVTVAFGISTDRPVSGDWNGDGQTDVGVWRPSTGRFYLDVNGNYLWDPGSDVVTVPFGLSSDRPVSGDWNGDGLTDVGVWRPSTGRFYLDANGSYTWDPNIDAVTVPFGLASDMPVAGIW